MASVPAEWITKLQLPEVEGTEYVYSYIIDDDMNIQLFEAMNKITYNKLHELITRIMMEKKFKYKLIRMFYKNSTMCEYSEDITSEKRLYIRVLKDHVEMTLITLYYINKLFNKIVRNNKFKKIYTMNFPHESFIGNESYYYVLNYFGLSGVINYSTVREALLQAHIRGKLNYYE